MFEPSSREGVSSYILFQFSAETDPMTRPPEGQFPPPPAYRTSHFLLTAPSSQTPLSAPPVRRKGSCCHPIPLVRPLLCSDGLNQTSDGTSSSSHRPPPPHTPHRQLIACSNSHSPVCLLFEHVHLSSLLGSECILPVGGV